MNKMFAGRYLKEGFRKSFSKTGREGFRKSFAIKILEKSLSKNLDAGRYWKPAGGF